MGREKETLFEERLQHAQLPTDLPHPTEEATFGAGCFWCTESCFLHIDGVRHVVSGYAGGYLRNPTYHDITLGKSGHAEVARIYYNPQIVTYSQLLDVFWKIHDPTSLNQQGPDIGSHYRSTIMFHNEF